MASRLFVTEYQGTAVDTSRARAQIADGSGSWVENANSPITISGSHAESATFSAGTTFIRVKAEVQCSILIGTGAVATTSNAMMSAGDTEYFGVKAGDRISVIAN